MVCLLFLWSIGWLVSLVEGDMILIDLSNDPFEQTNLYEDPEYTDVRDVLELRLSFFKNLSVVEDLEPSLDNDFLNAAGGLVPWLDGNATTTTDDEDDPTPDDPGTGGPEIPVAPVEGAPHLVYILLDDVGWNDVNYNGNGGSTWLQAATPNMDALAAQGITLTQHYTSWVCGPTRASLMTGKYAYRLGYGRMPEVGAVLPLSERTIAQELKSVGYFTSLIGKWHLGLYRTAYTPNKRGFDSWYGYLSGSVGFYSKISSGYFDLHEQDKLLVNDPEAVEEHLTSLLQAKARKAILEHATQRQGQPLFLYYAPQSVHLGGVEGLEAPARYLTRCSPGQVTTAGNASGDFSQHRAYCALIIMLDESIGDMACALKETGMYNNSFIVVASDNGALSNQFPGANEPFRGGKGAFLQGGIRNTAFIHAPTIIPSDRHGATYDGLVHISDWFPTLMHLATGDGSITSSGIGSGSGSSFWNSSQKLDGINVLDAMLQGGPSPRTEMFHNYDASREKGALQLGSIKLIVGTLSKANVRDIAYFAEAPTNGTCLVDRYLSAPTQTPTITSTHSPTSLPTFFPPPFPSVAPTHTPTLLPTHPPSPPPPTLSPVSPFVETLEDYSFDYNGCLQDCPALTLNTLSNFTEFCSLLAVEYDCFTDCGASMLESISMHCECSSGRVEDAFISDSSSQFDASEAFCCEHQECRDSIVEYYVAKDTSHILTTEITLAIFTEDCQGSSEFECSTADPSTSPQISPTPFPASVPSNSPQIKPTPFPTSSQSKSPQISPTPLPTLKRHNTLPPTPRPAPISLSPTSAPQLRGNSNDSIVSGTTLPGTDDPDDVVGNEAVPVWALIGGGVSVVFCAVAVCWFARPPTDFPLPKTARCT